MRLGIERYVVRRSISTVFALLIAGFANYYCSYSQEPWMVITALVVCQTTRGAVLKQSIHSFFLLLLVAAFFPTTLPHQMEDRLLDVLLGGCIGILCSQFVFPVRPYWEFKQGVLPVLDALMAYAAAFVEQNNEKMTQHLWQIEVVLQSQHSQYPEWVYEVGFNPGLRSGFRFFLIHLERLTEMFFAFQYLMKQEAELSSLMLDMQHVMQANVELLTTLKVYFAKNQLHQVQADYTSDMTELEQGLREVTPPDLELLDMSSDYVTATSMVRTLKDMRELLLQLVLSLPTATKDAIPG